MKHSDPVPLPEFGAMGDPGGSCRQDEVPENQSIPNNGAKQGDDFPTCMAEALDILRERAMRHGLVEVAHLLEVAALAARDAVSVPADRPCQPARNSGDMPPTPI
jgi:hypothetical protein